jgi:acetolactate synthase-1/2/3 large subunit
MKKNGADVLIEHLKTNDVDTVFAITGAGNLAIIDALYRDGGFKVIYSHHEQAVAMEAQGYARVSGKIGVALVTTGGGTSNVLTGVLSAHLDSVPLLVISGNESSFHCSKSSNLRAYGVQGFDSVAVLSPVTKFSERIESEVDISSTVQRAFRAALNERKGPAHIDFPMDIQRMPCNIGEISKVKIEIDSPSLSYDLILSKISESKRPLFYFGNGCRDSVSETVQLLEKLRAPYAVSWSAIDLFSHDDPLNIGSIGIYGSHSANIILQKSDLVICVGTRLAIPQIGYNKKDFGRKAQKIVVDIDKSELEKFASENWTLIHESAQVFLKNLNQSISGLQEFPEWYPEIQKIKKRLPLIEHIGPEPELGYVHSARVLQTLPEILSKDAIIVTDVGAPLLNGHYILKPTSGQRLFTSQGLGEMGFGLPAAIGAFFAEPNRQIVCLNTDGAIMFNLQELQLIKHHQIPLKLFIFNNGGYGMIKISQENLFDSRLSGSDISSGISFPNFKEIADAFGLEYKVISSVDELVKSRELSSETSAVLFDVIMDPRQKYFPRLATNKLPDGSFVSPPLEDLAPFISIDLLEELLGYRPLDASFEARGIHPNNG